MNKIDFIEINPKKDIQDLIKKYEKETGTILQPAQDARILINLIAYYANLIKNQVNDAANLNLVEKSRFPILDFLGKYKKCPRLKAQKGIDRLKITLKNPLERDFKIISGLEITSEDGVDIFKTIEDIFIASGETETVVKIESIEATDEVNKYKPGEINTLVVSSYDNIIEKVENIDGVKGGSKDEDDGNYIERILLAPEGFSVAGPEAAYIYFILSAHPDILDVDIDVPKEDIKVTLNGSETIIKENECSNSNFEILLDNIEEEITLTLKKTLNIGDILKIKIPHPYKIIPYILTKDGGATDAILDKVKEDLKPVKPLSDYVLPKSANVVNYIISGTIYLKKQSNYETVKKLVETVLNNYLKDEYKKSVVKNQIITSICNIDGVYDFKPSEEVSDLQSIKNAWYKGAVGELSFERVEL